MPAPLGKDMWPPTPKMGPSSHPLMIGGPSGAPSRQNHATDLATASPDELECHGPVYVVPSFFPFL
jgi:hypothetical protein